MQLKMENPEKIPPENFESRTLIGYTEREDGINGNVSEVIKERIKQHFGVEE